MPLDPLTAVYGWFRLALLAAAWGGCALLWRRPRAGASLGLVLAVNLALWAACVWPLERLYGLQEHNDRGFNVGMAAVAAAGNSPFEHTQRGFANLEPFWSALVAALSLYRPENVIAVYGGLAPLALAGVALGLYFGMRREGGEDRWELALTAFAVLGLSSFSLSQRTPVPPLWAANFLYKPNHILAFALVPLAIGSALPRLRALRLGLLLGLLAWAFLVHWAFLLPGLALGMALRPAPEREWRRLAAAAALSLALAAPYLAHLARDYSPFERDLSPEQIWLDPLGQRLAPPHWSTLDLGPLLLLGAAGAAVWWRRRGPRDALLLGLFAASWLFWIGYQLGAFVGFTPEPDEQHYFLRLSLALGAGTGLHALAGHLERLHGLLPGRGSLLVLAAALPLSFSAYWDPPSMDRYFRWDRVPIGPKVRAYGEWVRQNTRSDAVFAAGRSACMWIPVFSGRRVLLADASRPPRDYAARKEAERILVLSRKPELIRATARRFGVDYLAVDGEMLREYGEAAFEGLGRLPAYELVYQSSALRIFAIR